MNWELSRREGSVVSFRDVFLDFLIIELRFYSFLRVVFNIEI